MAPANSLKGTTMHSSLVGHLNQCWLVEIPDGTEHLLSEVNVVTGGVPPFIGMEGTVVTLTGYHGPYLRFYARWTSGTPISAVAASATQSAM